MCIAKEKKKKDMSNCERRKGKKDRRKKEKRQKALLIPSSVTHTHTNTKLTDPMIGISTDQRFLLHEMSHGHQIISLRAVLSFTKKCDFSVTIKDILIILL